MEQRIIAADAILIRGIRIVRTGEIHQLIGRIVLEVEQVSVISVNHEGIFARMGGVDGDGALRDGTKVIFVRSRITRKIRRRIVISGVWILWIDKVDLRLLRRDSFIIVVMSEQLAHAVRVRMDFGVGKRTDVQTAQPL